MTNDRKKQIENLTVDILKEYRLFQVNGVAPIFVKDELQKRFTFTFHEVDMESNLQGAIFQGKKSVKIVVNSTIDNIGRKNFTYAHEMGHYFLMHDLSTLVCTQANLDGGLAVKNPQEAEANYFASCFLMPKKYVYWNYYYAMVNLLNISQPYQKLYVDSVHYGNWKIMSKYFESCCGVSASALKIRLEELNLLDWKLKNNTQPQNSNNLSNWFKMEFNL